MAYASPSNVAMYTHNILAGEPGFSVASSPTLREVRNWLSSGCSIIESTLAGCNYDVPVAEGSTAYEWISNLNAKYAAAQVEHSRTLATVAADERTRGQYFEEQFWEGLEKICAGDMSLAGLSRSATGKLYVGGISVDDKQTRESDSDRVKPRFIREQFRFPGTLTPAGTTASAA